MSDIEIGGVSYANTGTSAVTTKKATSSGSGGVGLGYDASKSSASAVTTQSSQSENTEYNGEGKRGLRFSLALMLLLWIISIGIRWISFSWSAVDCNSYDDNLFNEFCTKQKVLFRLSAIISIFFTLLSVISLFSVEKFDYYWITVKIPFVLVTAFCMLYFSGANFFNDTLFVWWARIAAFIFLVFQQFIVLDFAYKWNERWFTNAEYSSDSMVNHAMTNSDMHKACTSIWYVFMLIASIIMLAVFIVAMALLLHFYGGPGCPASNTIISLSIAGMTLALLIQLSTANGSLITTTVLMMYVAYITYSAVALNPNSECNPFSESDPNSNYGIGPSVLGIVFSFVSIVYLGSITTRSIAAFLVSGGITQSSVTNVIAGRSSGISSTLDLKNKLKSSIFVFSFVNAFLALYLSMVLTNWGVETVSGLAAMWLQAVAAWLVIVLYIIALILPVFDILPKSIWDLMPTSAI